MTFQNSPSSPHKSGLDGISFKFADSLESGGIGDPKKAGILGNDLLYSGKITVHAAGWGKAVTAQSKEVSKKAFRRLTLRDVASDVIR